jgi:hypothetical protein
LISSSWDEKPPPEADGQSVREYLSDTVVNTYYHDFYHNTDDFRAKYIAKHQKEPFVNAFNHWRWNLGKKVTTFQHDEGTHRLSVYKDWFLDNIMRQSDHETLVVLPIANVEPNYRDSTPPKIGVQRGFDQLFVPPILGAPDVVVPIGEFPYHSRISNREEFLPVGVDVVGLPGSDLWLIDTLEGCLKSSGRPQIVRTGTRCFG